MASGWEVIDDQYLLNTSALEDRLTHVQQLDQISGKLGPRLMEPYMEAAARCCVENLGFKLDEGVRAVSDRGEEVSQLNNRRSVPLGRDRVGDLCGPIGGKLTIQLTIFVGLYQQSRNAQKPRINHKRLNRY